MLRQQGDSVPNLMVTTDFETDTVHLRFRLSRAEREDMSLRQAGDYEMGVALLLSSLQPDEVYEGDADAMMDAMERTEWVMSEKDFRRLRLFPEDAE